MLLRGSVAGDVLVVGSHVVILGSVAGDVRVVASDVELRGAISGNVSIAGRSLTLTDNASVGKNIAFAGQLFNLASAVAGDVQLFLFDPAESHIAKTASVDGVLTVRSTKTPTVDDGARLQHAIEHTVPRAVTVSVGDMLFDRVIAFFSMLLVGLVVVHLFLRPSLVIASIMSNRPWRDVGWGIAALVLPPLIAIFLAFTVIGIPLAVMIVFVWMILLYSARVFAAVTIGLHLFAKLDRKKRFHSIVLPLLLGVGIIIALGSIPFAGRIITAFITLWALGGIALFVWTFFREIHAPQSAQHHNGKNQ